MDNDTRFGVLFVGIFGILSLLVVVIVWMFQNHPKIMIDVLLYSWWGFCFIFVVGGTAFGITEIIMEKYNGKK